MGGRLLVFLCDFLGDFSVISSPYWGVISWFYLLPWLPCSSCSSVAVLVRGVVSVAQIWHYKYFHTLGYLLHTLSLHGLGYVTTFLTFRYHLPINVLLKVCDSDLKIGNSSSVSFTTLSLSFSQNFPTVLLSSIAFHNNLWADENIEVTCIFKSSNLDKN